MAVSISNIDAEIQYADALQEILDLQIRNSVVEAEREHQKHTIRHLEGRLNSAREPSSCSSAESMQVANLGRRLELMEDAMIKEGLLFPRKRR